MSHLSKTYIFIDESGDPSFYAKGNRSIAGRPGFMPLLLIGMIKVTDKKALRDSILGFMEELRQDPLYNSLPCITNPKGWYLHDSYDNIEVQVRFTSFLRQLGGFEFYCVIGRKRLDVFHKKHNNSEAEFYFDLVRHLLQDQLGDEATHYQILLSARNKSNQHRLSAAIDKALPGNGDGLQNPKGISYNSTIVRSQDTPELSVVDYLLWALQRYIIRGEQRFYQALQEKYLSIIDLYDFDKEKSEKPLAHYTRNNPFTLEAASRFLSDGYV